jgi:hypothetical protein
MQKDELDRQQADGTGLMRPRWIFSAKSPAVRPEGRGTLPEGGCSLLLELGAGQGRDTLYFAGLGLRVYALDYRESGLWGSSTRASGLTWAR